MVVFASRIVLVVSIEEIVVVVNPVAYKKIPVHTVKMQPKTKIGEFLVLFPHHKKNPATIAMRNKDYIYIFFHFFCRLKMAQPINWLAFN